MSVRNTRPKYRCMSILSIFNSVFEPRTVMAMESVVGLIKAAMLWLQAASDNPFAPETLLAVMVSTVCFVAGAKLLLNWLTSLYTAQSIAVATASSPKANFWCRFKSVVAWAQNSSPKLKPQTQATNRRSKSP